MPNKLLVVIGGPTASGKTETAIQLAQIYHTEIINADSRQVYKELNIGVGKPDSSQLALVPHHLIGHVSIHDHYSAGTYTEEALGIIHALFKHHDVILLSGGTGLYIKSVLDGFDDIPDIPKEVTAYWTNVWEEKGNQPLIDELATLDPAYLEIVDRKNHARLIRAVTVSAFTRRPFSSFRVGQKAEHNFRILRIALELPRKELYERINQRVMDMIQHGWLDEAIALYPYRGLKALQTVGYKELFEVIGGKLSIEEAIPKIKQSTRRYAKRQLTWFRNQGEWYWISPADIDAVRALIQSRLI